MAEKSYTVQPCRLAHDDIRLLPTIGARTKARQSLVDRQPFPMHFATYTDAERAARKAGPEFEVVVQS